ncbi:outer membrane beta-barrel protein [Undibacterium flavidum]|uniref:Outer membrane beta-barrel protein n=1 Tax=Undibacterium flavidum TaxID=2762297 RepID=A0ABR6Y927_9BURK|nr:outer membrane beta-barrel protein [Undibacterium flavidum]MBC3872679.1 outer membrane beta-barrel protein [Undibacterium flavidum]
MKKLFSVVAVAIQFGVASFACLSFAQVAHAQQVYVGASVMTPGEGKWSYAPGVSVADYDHSLAKKIYAGIELDRDLSIEAGYLDWGYRFQSPSIGSQHSMSRQLQLKINMVYAAAKISKPVSDNWTLFAKAGIARTQFDNDQVSSDSYVRGLVGFGAEYSVTKQLGLVVEFHRAGSNQGTPQQKLEAGIKWRF